MDLIQQPKIPTIPGSPDAPLWEETKPGYLQLYCTGNDISGLVGSRKKGTLTSCLENVHRPYANNKLITTPLQVEEVPNCTKLHSIVRILEQIHLAKCNLDLAVVCSSPVIESQLTEVLMRYDIDFIPMSVLMKPIPPPVHGILIRFRKNPNKEKPPRYRMRVDHIIVYDSSLVPERESITTHFKGVYYDRPQIVSLVCLQSADLRICNYRDAHPDQMKDPDAKLLTLPRAQKALLDNPQYKKVRLFARTIHNNLMLERLVNWMVLKDGSVFQPLGPPYPSRLNPPPTPMQQAPRRKKGKKRAQDPDDVAEVKKIKLEEFGSNDNQSSPTARLEEGKSSGSNKLGNPAVKLEAVHVSNIPADNTDIATSSTNDTEPKKLSNVLDSFEAALDKAHNDLLKFVTDF